MIKTICKIMLGGTIAIIIGWIVVLAGCFMLLIVGRGGKIEIAPHILIIMSSILFLLGGSLGGLYLNE